MPRRSGSVGVKIDMVVEVQVDSQRVLRLILTRGSLSHPLDSRLRLMLAQIDRGRIHRTPNQALNKDRHNKNIISHLVLLVGNFIVVYVIGDQGLVIGVGRDPFNQLDIPLLQWDNPKGLAPIGVVEMMQAEIQEEGVDRRDASTSIESFGPSKMELTIDDESKEHESKHLQLIFHDA
ncbi:uncharacterized protein G2W53_041452 [Senna tora]|uniref:Uncharacterized protein n=1 Tax=Senna tora TaxID=362788 RepID=A0A834W1E3_9FABA|nr:uncharacterized protein G2W53_041452 [Senna tora]